MIVILRFIQNSIERLNVAFGFLFTLYQNLILIYNYKDIKLPIQDFMNVVQVTGNGIRKYKLVSKMTLPYFESCLSFMITSNLYKVIRK